MIIITGASSGIGEACARTFAKARHQLILIARREEKLKNLSAQIKSEFSTQPAYFSLDVQDAKAIDTLIKNNEDLFAQTTVLINNAGLARGLAPIQEGSLSDWEEMINTNIKGLLYMTRAILPFMIKKSEGHIINIGSVAGRWTYPNGNVYCATKYAVRSLTESMRLDLSGTGIRVTEIAPGMAKTEFSEARFRDKAKADAVYAGMKPLTAQDIAESVEWCVSRPKHVNVQEIVIYPTDQASPTVVNRR